MQKENKEEADHISIMTDPELHPLPISPNDPLQLHLKQNPKQSLKPEEQEETFDLKQIQSQGLTDNFYNLDPFQTSNFGSSSRFFIIKSYQEEDVHKAIKYKVWSSTEVGNQKLNEAYNDTKQLSQESDIYLFFSVNQSKHFCGVAKMTSDVNTRKQQYFWDQRGKWTGSFSIDWLQIKDIPNTDLFGFQNQLNENRPVYQGYDTQEIYPDVGQQLYHFFEKYNSVTKILDDFQYYDEKEQMQKQIRIQKRNQGKTQNQFKHRQTHQKNQIEQFSKNYIEQFEIQIENKENQMKQKVKIWNKQTQNKKQ